MATRREHSKPLFHRPRKLGSRETGHRPKPQVHSEGATLLADEVKNRQRAFIDMIAEAATQLLDEDGRAFE